MFILAETMQVPGEEYSWLWKQESWDSTIPDNCEEQHPELHSYIKLAPGPLHLCFHCKHFQNNILQQNSYAPRIHKICCQSVQ